MINTLAIGTNKFVSPEIRPSTTYQSVVPEGHGVRILLNLPARDLLATDFRIRQNGEDKTPVSAKVVSDASYPDYETGRIWDINLGLDWLIDDSTIEIEYLGNAKIVNFLNTNVPNGSLVRQQGINLVQRQRAFSIHFSMATFTIPSDGNQQSPYTASPALFNPTGITSAASLDNWISAAQAYGAETFYITTQHSDGFCLWDSASYPTRNIRTASTWWAAHGFDIIAAFCTKVRAAGMKVGFYNCIWNTKWEADNAALKISNYTAWKAAYTAYKLALITELCTNYGTIDEIVFDGWAGIGGVYPTYVEVVKATITNAVKTLQPGCAIIMNDYNRALTDSDVNLYEIGVGTEDFNIDNLSDLIGGGPDFPTKITQAPNLVWATPTLSGNSWFNDPANQTYKSAAYFRAMAQEVTNRFGAMIFNLSPDTTGLISPAKIAYLSSLNPAND